MKCAFDRREFLWRFGGGLGGIAMAHLLGNTICWLTKFKPRRGIERRPASSAPRPNASCNCSCPARPASATRSITSRELIERHGQKFDPGGKVELFQSDPGAVHEKPLGLEAVRRSAANGSAISCRISRRAPMTSRSFIRWSPNRTCMARRRSCRTPASCCPDFPRMGAWISYGLGSMNRESADVRRAAGSCAGLRRTARRIGAPDFCPPRTRAR